MKIELVIGNKNYSSWSLRSWFLLREAGIEFEEHRIALDQDDTAAQIAKYSNAGRVPVLLLDSLVIWDTLAIAETVAERWPEKQLWPEEPNARAHARSISAEMHAGFETLRRCMPMNCRAMGRQVELPDSLTADIDRIIAIWVDCHRRYGSNGDWLFGKFSIADTMYAPVVLRFRTYGINLPDATRIYANKVLQSEAIQEWLAAAETEVEVLHDGEVGR